MKKFVSQNNSLITQKTQNILLIIIIIGMIVLIALLAFFIGKSGAQTERNNIEKSVPLASPTVSITTQPVIPVKDVQGCINKSKSAYNLCADNCTNQSTIKSQSCPVNDANQHQSCLNQILTANSLCISDCSSTAKIAMNNCTK